MQGFFHLECRHIFSKEVLELLFCEHRLNHPKNDGPQLTGVMQGADLASGLIQEFVAPLDEGISNINSDVGISATNGSIESTGKEEVSIEIENFMTIYSDAYNLPRVVTETKDTIVQAKYAERIIDQKKAIIDSIDNTIQ